MKSVRLAYGLFLVIAVLLAVFNPAYHFFMLLALGAVLPGLSWLYLRYISRCVRWCAHSVKPICFKGEKVRLELALTNAGVLPVTGTAVTIGCFNRFFPKEKAETVMAALGAGEKSVLPVLLESRYCGRLEIEIKEMILTDPLLLFKRKIKIGFHASVTVMPDIRVPVAAGGEIFPAECESGAKGQDAFESVGIREYMPGDRLRQIHWKLSAKQRRLMSREYGRVQEAEAVIRLDYRVSDLSMETLATVDRRMEQAFLQSRLYLKQGVRHSFCRCNGEFEDWFCVEAEDDLFSAAVFLMEAPLKTPS